jgi:parvulin-like peptidyl-prolyl isomerase
MQRAAEAAAALRAGDSFESVEARYGDEQVAPLPDAYLPPAKVREYVGPSVSRIAMELEAGEVSDPIVSGGGVYVLVVRDKEPPSAPSLADIEDQVRAEVKRRAGDQAVRDTLEQLRLAGNVVEREALP